MTIKKWAFRILAIYLVVLVAWLIFSLASLRFERVAAVGARFSEPYLGLVANGQVYLGEVAVNGERIGIEGQTSDAVPQDWSQVKTWVFLLEGFPAILTNKPAKDLGLNVEDIAKTKPGHNVVRIRGGISLRASVLPFYVSRQKIALIDYATMRATYTEDCWATLINTAVAFEVDKTYTQSCKRTK